MTHSYTTAELTNIAIRVSLADETGDATLSRFIEEHPKFAGNPYQDVLIMFLGWALGDNWVEACKQY